jgi:hypothetical protein
LNERFFGARDRVGDVVESGIGIEEMDADHPTEANLAAVKASDAELTRRGAGGAKSAPFRINPVRGRRRAPRTSRVRRADSCSDLRKLCAWAILGLNQ